MHVWVCAYTYVYRHTYIVFIMLYTQTYISKVLFYSILFYKLMHHSWMDVMYCGPAAGTVQDFLSNFRDVEPSFQVHPCLSGLIVGGLRSLLLAWVSWPRFP